MTAPIEITGALVEKSEKGHACLLNIMGNEYIAYQINNKREINVLKNNEIVFKSKYVCHSFFQKVFGYGLYSYTDSLGNEIFQLYKTGLIKINTKLVDHRGKEHIIPKDNSFSINEIGFKIIVKGTKFKSTILNNEYLSLSLLLSHFCWLRQQIWDNMC